MQSCELKTCRSLGQRARNRSGHDVLSSDIRAQAKASSTLARTIVATRQCGRGFIHTPCRGRLTSTQVPIRRVVDVRYDNRQSLLTMNLTIHQHRQSETATDTEAAEELSEFFKSMRRVRTVTDFNMDSF